MIYHHQVSDDGKISRHWLEAEKSRHAVGQQQVESEHERQDALKRGKATSCVIGPKCVGTRFNALLTVQIPLSNGFLRNAAALTCGRSSSSVCRRCVFRHHARMMMMMMMMMVIT